MIPFRPSSAATVSIAVAATTANVQIMPTGTTGNYSCRIHNDGTATVWLRFGDNTVTSTIPSGATAGGMSVPAGGCEVVTVRGTHVAAIAAGATGNIYFTPGEGL